MTRIGCHCKGPRAERPWEVLASLLVAALGLAVITLTVAVGARGSPPLQEAEDEAREELAGEEE